MALQKAELTGIAKKTPYPRKNASQIRRSAYEPTNHAYRAYKTTRYTTTDLPDNLLSVTVRASCVRNSILSSKIVLRYGVVVLHCRRDTSRA